MSPEQPDVEQQPDVELTARWLSPESIEITVVAHQSVCFFDRALVPAGPEFKPGTGPYDASDRAHQWVDAESCALVVSLSNQTQRGASYREFFEYNAARCVPAGGTFSRRVAVPSPLTLWHPLETLPRPLTYRPSSVRVEIGYLPEAALDLTSRAIVGGEELTAPRAVWMDKKLPEFLSAQQFAAATLPLPKEAVLYRMPGVDAPGACPGS